MYKSSVFLLLLLYSSLIHLATSTFDWDNFPSCAQPILEAFAPPSCDHGSSTDYEAIQTNNCLCPNLGFFTDVATNIFASCGCTVLQQSAQVINNNCEKLSDYAPALGVDDFISTGDRGEQTCGVSQGGWNAASIAGIVVGVLFGVIATVLSTLQLLVSRGRVTNPTAVQFAPLPYIRDFFRCLRCC